MAVKQMGQASGWEVSAKPSLCSAVILFIGFASRCLRLTKIMQLSAVSLCFQSHYYTKCSSAKFRVSLDIQVDTEPMSPISTFLTDVDWMNCYDLKLAFCFFILFCQFTNYNQDRRL